MRKLPGLLCLLAVCALATGCGPILSTYLILNAQTEIDGAQAAEAEKYAVYEITMAAQYIHKAREEQGYADYGPAIDYAFKAEEMAKKANEKAQEEKKRILENPSSGTWEAPTEEGQAPSVIIKKKQDTAKPPEGGLKVVPIPIEEGPKPK